MDEIEAALSGTELVVSSTGSTGSVVHASMVGRARAGPAGRTFILDLAVPRDVDPEVTAIPGVALADIDDLRYLVAGRRGQTAAEVDRAKGIVAEETRRYAVARRAARLAPLIEALHARGEAIRAEEVRRIVGRLGTDRDRRTVDALTRRIVRRLLHEPVTRLKDRAGRGVGQDAARTLAELFGLEPPE
jgi:glutamyl-tRNA reductase